MKTELEQIFNRLETFGDICAPCYNHPENIDQEHFPCNGSCFIQDSWGDIYNYINGKLSSVNLVMNLENLVGVLDKIYYLKKKSLERGELYNSIVGMLINDLSKYIMVNLDYAYLWKGYDILEYLEAIDIGYTRDADLYQYHSPILMRPLIEKAKKMKDFPNGPMPAVGPLAIPKVQELLQRLTDNNLCDEYHKWKDTSALKEMAQVAYIIAALAKLPKSTKWSEFEKLWGVKGLQNSFNKKTYNAEKDNYQEGDFDGYILDIFPEFKLN